MGNFTSLLTGIKFIGWCSSINDFIWVNNVVREKFTIVYIIRETFEENRVEKVVVNDEILWLNKNHTEGLDEYSRTSFTP